MRKLVATAEHAAKNIRAFAEEVKDNAELRAVLGHVHAWYALQLADGRWVFGPSKFIGYQNNTAKEYLRTYKTNADGRETERVLRDLGIEIDPTSRLGRELAEALEAFLNQLGRKPRRDYRMKLISVKPELATRQRRESDDVLLARISSDPSICGGRPCIKGSRMRVTDIVDAIADGVTQDQLLADFDYLTADDIVAALRYAARATDHRIVRVA